MGAAARTLAATRPRRRRRSRRWWMLTTFTPLPVPTCPGVDHADFSADGRYMYLSCEYLGAMIELDLEGQPRIIRTLSLSPKPASPQDVKLAPDGSLLYVADQDRAGVWEIDPA